uniref:Uncharacterized protein n=1 Tax=Arundo donax TaxID=35708 RepID=A0A0A8ZVH2_ARUDO
MAIDISLHFQIESRSVYNCLKSVQITLPGIWTNYPYSC